MTPSPQQRPWQLHWSPSQEQASPPIDIAERLSAVVEDRVSSAAEVVAEASRGLLAWLLNRPAGWTWASAQRDLVRLLEPLRAAHGWRAPVALWMGALEAACGDSQPMGPGVGPREGLGEELGLWLGGLDELSPGPNPWDGRPGSRGARLPERGLCAAGPLESLGNGEVVAVYGDSETVALALLQAQREGKRPEVYVSEGGPELRGRRLATRLAKGGLRVHFHYDAALLQRLGHVDRIWLGTEAIGARSFLGLVGTRSLLEEAERLGVPATLLATSDKLAPGGELCLPNWGSSRDWLLWERAPEGVQLASQPYEAVPLEWIGQISDEHGLGSAADIALRALRTDRPQSYGSGPGRKPLPNPRLAGQVRPT